MDPNETLREIRELIRVFDDSDADDKDTAQQVAAGLATKFEALDTWLSGGGFPPEEWREGPDARYVTGDGQPHASLRAAFGHADEVQASTGHIIAVEPLGGPIPGVDGSHLPENAELWA